MLRGPGQPVLFCKLLTVQIETLKKTSRNFHLGGEGVEKSGFEFEIQFCGKCNASTPNRT